MEKNERILIVFLIVFAISLTSVVTIGIYMAEQEKNTSSVSVDEYIVTDKSTDSHYKGKVIAKTYYLDVTEKEDMSHKKRIQVSKSEYEKIEDGDIIKLKFFYNEEKLVDVEIVE